MARRSAVEQIVIEEKTVSEAILKLIASREKASAWHLKWAKFEEHEFLIFLFSKLAEMRWIWNETMKQFSDKHQEYSKTFKDIYHEERVIEDAKKALQACETYINKIKKQIENAQRKSDGVKLHSLDQELNSQIGMKEHLEKKIDSQSSKLFKFKTDQIQKGLLIQAQAGLQLADQLRHLFVAQLRIADILGTSSSDNSATWQMITQVMIGLSDTLGFYPPPTGSVDPLPSPSESPHQNRKSNGESPLHSPVPVPNPGAQTPTGRRSFPFSLRPLPQEPIDIDPPSHPPPPPPPSSHYTPTHMSPHHHTSYHNSNYTSKHVYSQPQHSAGSRVKFSRISSDITPQTVNSSSYVHNPRSSIVILEEDQEEFLMSKEPVVRSRSVSQPYRDFSPRHKNILRLESNDQVTGFRSRSHTQSETAILEREYDKIRTPKSHPDVEILGSGSDSGYADPIDTLRKYYNSQSKSESDPPYQSLEEIQRIRQAQMNRIEESHDDPAYSRPFDCLIGLPGPVKVKGEMQKMYTPLSVRRVSSPDYPVQLVPVGGTRNKKKYRIPRRLLHGSSGSDETLSSSLSPSPEPDFHPLVRNQRSGSLDRLLEPTKISTARRQEQRMLKARINSEGDLLSERIIISQETLSPLTIGSVTSDNSSSSLQPSPIHAPSPVELTRMQNGFARLVYPDLSMSQSQ